MNVLCPGYFGGEAGSRWDGPGVLRPLTDTSSFILYYPRAPKMPHRCCTAARQVRSGGCTGALWVLRGGGSDAAQVLHGACPDAPRVSSPAAMCHAGIGSPRAVFTGRSHLTALHGKGRCSPHLGLLSSLNSVTSAPTPAGSCTTPQACLRKPAVSLRVLTLLPSPQVLGDRELGIPQRSGDSFLPSSCHSSLR